MLGPSFYWSSFNDETGFGDGDDGHLIFGGRRPRFSLAGARKQTWPRAGLLHYDGSGTGASYTQAARVAAALALARSARPLEG